MLLETKSSWQDGRAVREGKLLRRWVSAKGRLCLIWGTWSPEGMINWFFYCLIAVKVFAHLESHVK